MITDPELLRTFFDKSVLVIDDEKFSRSIIGRLLHPLTIIEADDGSLGLHQFRANPSVAMILCDFNMPVMDGLKFLKAVRAGFQGVNNTVPVLMLTGTSDSALVSVALKLDVDGFIVKPVSQSALETRMKHVLGRPNEVKMPKHYADIAVDEVSERLLGSKDPICTPAEVEKLKKAAEPAVTPAGRKLSLDAVQPQAVLTTDIRAPTGELLIAAGVPLTQRLIRRLLELAPLGIAPDHVWVEN